MKIIVNSKVVYEGEVLNEAQIGETINNDINEKDLVVDKIFVNGSELDSSADYAGSFDKDDVIEVKTISKKSYLDNQLLTAREYLQRALPAMKELTDELYHGPQAETWYNLSQLLEGIEWLTIFVAEIQGNKHLYSTWHSNISVENTFKELLNNMADAIENEDPVLIADIIVYELMEVLNALNNDIEKTIKAEVPGHDIH